MHCSASPRTTASSPSTRTSGARRTAPRLPPCVRCCARWASSSRTTLRRRPPCRSSRPSAGRKRCRRSWCGKPGRPREVELRLPPERLGRALHFRVQEENGAEHDAAIAPDALVEIERAPDGTTRAWRFTTDLALPEGYHRLTLLADEEVLGVAQLIVAPATCYEPPSFAAGHRIFGPAVQLYGVTSRRNWGIGDFTDLATIVEQWGAQGAAIVGVNPLHALFPHDPARASPYSPSSRLFLNTLYIDVEAVPELAECEEARQLVASAAFQARLEALRARACVDYAGGRRGEARSAGASRRAFPRAPSRAVDAARGRVPRIRPAGRRGHRAPRALRGAAGPPPWRGCRRVGLAPMAGAVSRSRQPRGAELRARASRGHRHRALPAVAGRPAAAARRRARPRSRDGAGALPRPRGLDRPRRRRGVVEPVALRRVGERRRAARRVQSPGAGLGVAAADSARAAPHRVRPVHRHAARQHAPRGRAAHRSRDGPRAPVLGARRRKCRRRRVRALSARRPHGGARAREPATALPGHRRGPRDGAAGDPGRAARGEGALLSAALVRARRAGRLHGRRSAIRRTRSSPPRRTTCPRWPAGGSTATSPHARSAASSRGRMRPRRSASSARATASACWKRSRTPAFPRPSGNAACRRPKHSHPRSRGASSSFLRDRRRA